jgi:hypothetical protein
MALNTAISIDKVMIGTITAEPHFGLEVTTVGRIHLVGLAVRPHHHLRRGCT